MATSQAIALLEQLGKKLTAAASKNITDGPTLQPHEALIGVLNVLWLLKDAEKGEHVLLERENGTSATRPNTPPTTTTKNPLTTTEEAESRRENKGLEDSQWATVQPKRARKAGQREMRRPLRIDQ